MYSAVRCSTPGRPTRRRLRYSGTQWLRADALNVNAWTRGRSFLLCPLGPWQGTNHLRMRAPPRLLFDQRANRTEMFTPSARLCVLSPGFPRRCVLPASCSVALHTRALKGPAGVGWGGLGVKKSVFVKKFEWTWQTYGTRARQYDNYGADLVCIGPQWRSR